MAVVSKGRVYFGEYHKDGEDVIKAMREAHPSLLRRLLSKPLRRRRCHNKRNEEQQNREIRLRQLARVILVEKGYDPFHPEEEKV